MKRVITFLFIWLVVVNHTSAQQEEEKTSLFKVGSSLLMLKMGAIRSIGLNTFNDDLANSGIQQLPIIGLSTGIEFNAQIFNFGLGLEYQTFGYNSLVLNPGSLLAGSGDNIEIGGNEFSFLLGYDLLGKNENYRFEPYIGVGMRTTEFKIKMSDSSYTYNQILNGAQNVYEEEPRISLVLIPGLRFMAFSKNSIDFNFQVDYRFMAAQYKWAASDIPIKQLSGISFSIGLIFDLKKLFGKKE